MEDDSDDVTALIARARSGDREAQDALFRSLQAAVLDHVRLRMGRHLRADQDSIDVQQSVFKDVLGDLPMLAGQDQAALLAWLAKAVENKLRNRDRFRRRQRRDPARQVSLDNSSPQGSSQGLPPSPADGPATVVQKHDELEKVRAAIAELPERWRQVFTLRALEGLEWAEIAERSGESIKAVQGVFGRAQARLATLLRQD